MLAKVQAALPESQKLLIDDPIGELGNKLTSSQKVLLQFARAFLTRKPILLLDEPFAHLDADNQAVIFKMLLKLRNRRNVIVFSREDAPQREGINCLILG